MSIPYEQAIAFFVENEVRRSQAQFIYLNSQTSEQRYPLFIGMEETNMPSNNTKFNSYGHL